MKTLDQIRAEYAWECVQGVDDKYKEKYKNLAKGLPALVMSNGLMQTLAFLQGKSDGKNEHSQVLGHVLKWLNSPQAKLFGNTESSDFKSAMTALAGCDSLKYQRATEEALGILKWIRYLASTVA